MAGAGGKPVILLFLFVLAAFLIQAEGLAPIKVQIAKGTGDGKAYGRLEVSTDGTTWGTVCDTDWDDNEAKVVCGQLGFRWGRGNKNSTYGKGTGQILLDNVVCKGTETSLNQCGHGGWGKHACDHESEAGVHCYNSTVYVPSHADGIYGPVMAFKSNTWMPVCDTGWTDQKAKVVCTQLGFTTGYGFCCSTFSTWLESPLTSTKALTVGNCKATAKKIEDCQPAELATNTCGFQHQASVLCLNQKPGTDDFKVRLTYSGEPSDHSGRVEVRYKGKWGTICSTDPTDGIATVACKELGYAGGWGLGHRKGVPDLMIWMNNITCDGTEKSLKNCKSNGMGKVGFCDHDSDVNVLCYEGAYANVECRMTVLGTEYAGTNSTTRSGKTCQRWDSQSPHKHSSNSSIQFPEDDLADSKNYCRNPGGLEQGLWCFTTDKNKRWDYCDVPLCKRDTCKLTTKGTHYTGTVSETIGNETCQRWDSQSPHKHPYTKDKFPGRSLSKAKNYCRNPDGDSKGLWCYTTSARPVFDYCKVPYCAFHKDCKQTPMGREYTGTLSVSRNGFPCQDWSKFPFLSEKQFPEHDRSAAKNYCRNPRQKLGGPWCYVTYNGRTYFDYCNVPRCNEIKVRLMGGKEHRHGGRVEVEYDGTWGTICDRDWDDMDARVVCRQLGYADGKADRTTYKGKASGPVWFDKMQCSGNETSIEKCSSSGMWNVTDDQCTDHGLDAGVLCFIDVKLRYGYEKPGRAMGVVHLYNNSIWQKQCGSTWDDTASKVVCRELGGYKYSKTLCCATYGRVLLNPSKYYPKCYGNESKITECTFVEGSCPNFQTNYASVMCSKTPFNDFEIELTGAASSSANFSGNVYVMYSAVTGYICRNGWGDEEATVVCKGIGYKGGVALQYRVDKKLPILMSEFRCKGTEKHLQDCPYKNASSCSTPFLYSKQAGVLCYEKSGLKFRIVEKKPGEGRVEIQYDGVWGTVCDSLWSNSDARVFCRQNGYKDGTAVRGARYGRGTGPVYITGFSCSGVESSILQCINFGWRTRLYSSCMDHSRDAGVMCFHNVRLYNQLTSNGTTAAIMGPLVVMKYGRLGRVCSKGFDDKDALVVCRELRYPKGKYIGHGVFGKVYTTAWITDTGCTGTEDSIVDCKNKTSQYTCRNDYTDYASVLCYDGRTKPTLEMSTQRIYSKLGYYQKVVFNIFGMKTEICRTSWNDSVAKVACKQIGYVGGKAIFIYQWQQPPILTPSFNCSSTHTNIRQCSSELWKNKPCPFSYNQAAVLCYKNKPGIQFRIGEGQKIKGRAEIGYEGKWGTVCARYVGYSSLKRAAKVHCRSLGFSGGTVSYSTVKTASSSTPFYLNLVDCTGDEANLLQCKHYGWMSTTSRCTHQNDLKVSCDADVRIGNDNTKPYGPLWVRYRTAYYTYYFLVCDNTVTDREATVACRSLGYATGRAICCSAFGKQYGQMRVRDVRCAEGSTDVLKCKYKIIGSKYECPNQTYASVACFDKPPSNDLVISVNKSSVPIPRTVSGRVEVTHLGILGNICPSSWTDKEAMVVCRQSGYAGGQAYRHYPAAAGPFWLGDFKCNGYETTLLDCQMSGRGKGVRCNEKRSWGTEMTAAGVLCWPRKTSPPKYQIVGGKSSGAVEIEFNGTKGRMCSNDFYNYEASAVCKELGFLGGVPNYNFFIKNYTGDVFIDMLKCGPNATSVAECSHSAWGSRQRGSCVAVGVTCYGRVRLVYGPTSYFGMVQLNKKGVWYNMCDDGFDDTDAKVTCKGLGYADGMKVCCSAFRRGSSSNQRMNNVKCQESDKSLEDCKMDTGHCQSGNYASVYCVNATIDKNEATEFLLSDDYKLKYSGSVNVRYKGVIGRVCNQGWGDTEANIFCKQLGYKGGVAFTQNLIKSMPTMVANVTCKGTKIKRLEDCSFVDAITSKNGGCDRYSPTAGVLCAVRDASVSYRIVDGGRDYGRAEIKYDGVYGTICSSSWSGNDARVFCRNLGNGYVDGSRRYGVRNGRYRSPVWFTNTYCSGNESSVLQCQSSGWLQVPSYCKMHQSDAGVTCYKGERLDRGGYGKLWVYSKDKGVWGHVCNDGWDQNETDIVCKALGFKAGYTMCCGAFGRSYRSPIATKFNCSSGKEQNLLECRYQQAQRTDCTWKDYVAISCYNETSTSMRVRIRGWTNTGTVAIWFNRMYGRICPDNWDNKDARVVCRQLGYRDGTKYTHYEPSYYGSSMPYWTSNVNCKGKEKTLQQCDKTPLGNVTSCSSGHSAGVLCFRNSGVTTRLTGSNNPMTGTVEVMVDGVWGTLCNGYFNDNAASVICKSKNFADGISIGKTPYSRSNDANTVWFNRLRCRGNETSLDECYHSSWQKNSYYYCRYHRNDAAVNCFDHVRLMNRMKRKIEYSYLTNGPVQIYAGANAANKTWRPVCDEGFTDSSARRVCEELGFADGRAICCSAYGYQFGKTVVNNTVSLQTCDNSYSPIKDCVQTVAVCKNGTYASVMCVRDKGQVSYDHKFMFEKPDNNTGRVFVNVFNTTGRVCSEGWDDNDAMVFCKSQGYASGIAYNHSHAGTIYSWWQQTPYLVSDLACTGKEKSLEKCPFNNASALNRNCTNGHDAGVICFKRGEKIEYRRVPPPKDRPANAGRVEIKVGSVWGTVCDYGWDKFDAAVFCRSVDKNFHDGDPTYRASFGRGTGPIWLSHLQCKGNETSLHKCAHPGFGSSFDSTLYSSRSCRNHYTDAGVVCYNKVRLNQIYQRWKRHIQYGTVEVYDTTAKKWGGVCMGKWFDEKVAKIVCTELGYVDGRAVTKTSFGNVTGGILLNKASCSGSETSLTDCPPTSSDKCQSGDYAGVYCSDETITDTGLKVQLANDSYKTSESGAIQVTIDGVTGRVCGYKWGKLESDVACKMMGFVGGVPMTHIALNMQPTVMSNVTCSKTDSSLKTCKYSKWADNYACHILSYEAGVLCYRKNFEIRFGGGDTSPNPRYGRVDIKFDDVWGTVCDWYWSNADARVVCKEKGFRDGIAKLQSHYGGGHGPIWIEKFHCRGTETSLMECLNSGFNRTRSGYYYSRCSHRNDASVICYNEVIEVTKVRLAEGNKTFGRLEVYATGINNWGTVCGTQFGKNAAEVVCRMLGWSGGKPIWGVPPGTGEIIIDNVKCTGNEQHIKECKSNGVGSYSCDHKRDIGVSCEEAPPTTTTKATRTTKAGTKATTTTKAGTKATGTTPSPTKPVPTTRPTTTVPIKATQLPVLKRPGVLAAIIVPIVIIVLILLAVLGFILFKVRQAKSAELAGGDAAARESPMQISNVLYDMAMDEHPPAQDIPTNFENPLYDNANSNKPGVHLDDASTVYASVGGTPTLSTRSQDGNASPRPTKDRVSTNDTAGLVDNIHLDFPEGEDASNV